jgi:cyclic beta-1,2-glucan synthetase
MNRVGAEGRGESVWLAWFQIVVMHAIAAEADRRGDRDVMAECRIRAEELREAVERHGWDGSWYLRAFFDDGTPLGAAVNDECGIDSIAQSWAAIAGVADPERVGRAMDEALRQLVRPADRLVLLFTPPFDEGPLQPGYVKGYVPGVRENGGQYTHAAAWVVKGLATLGRGDEAYAVFDLLNPITMTSNGAGVARYKGEPYVVAGDVYANPDHVGRVGWTWYTGSAGWLYRVAHEDILGLHRVDATLQINPCIPSAWAGFAIRYRYGTAVYQINVSNPHRSTQGVRLIKVDGVESANGRIDLRDDGKEHAVIVEMGRTESQKPDLGFLGTKRDDAVAAAG